MPDPLCLLVEVPVCAFRPYASREYQDTYPVPTPASVYGMLLSLCGVRREDKGRHRGAEMALAVESLPERSKVFRKLRRGADLENTRPDYQDVLTDLRLWVWLRAGADPVDPPLAARVRAALADPASVRREGGLSLGESSYLINAVTLLGSGTVRELPGELFFVRPDTAGFYSLPVWVDHTDARNTVTRRFAVDDEPRSVPADLPWFAVPPAPPPPAPEPAAVRPRGKKSAN